jgi:hypothetical protein
MISTVPCQTQDRVIETEKNPFGLDVFAGSNIAHVRSNNQPTSE